MFNKIEYRGEREKDETLFLSLLDSLIETSDKTIYSKIASLSNASSLLNDYIEGINWVGFYLYDGNGLSLGPFQGDPACTFIPLNKGVCGKAALDKKTIIVDDVNTFPSHIACSEKSKSEIVLPIVKDDILYGVLDIDAPSYSRFSERDQEFLEKVIDIITKIF